MSTSSSTVLVTGESGTGKELVALAIHSLSSRHSKPFIRMNCAAVPDTLMDSELFGHEKGSFTSAVARRLVRFELANGGSLMLDEIGEMKTGLQAKLLRVLQENEVELVGGSRPIKIDCRVIATPNRDLAEAVRKDEFREHLFYRLNVLPIHVPALRERVDDIPLLAAAFLKSAQRKRGEAAGEMHFSDQAIASMCEYSWPGNIRELENLVERLSVMERGPVLGPEVLPFNDSSARTCQAVESAPPANVVNIDRPPTFDLASIEEDTIVGALKANQGHRQKTADALGISVRTLRNKIGAYRERGLSVA